MSLKARRNQRSTAGASTQTAEPEVNTQATEQAPPQEAPTQRQQSSVPAPKQETGVSVHKAGSIQDLNAGVLDNIEDMNDGGNFVTIDGKEFLFKATNETANTLDIVVTYGKRFYQWYDEENERYNNSDTKIDDRYKFKFEIRWLEENDEGEEVEYTMSLPTASAMRFTDYVKGLAKSGFGIGQVVTRMTISRQVRKGSTERYSRVEFENLGIAE